MALSKRLVVVGLGSIGRRHARLLAARPDLVVEWCESSPEALGLAQKEMDAPARLHDSFESMLATKPDMIVIATPHACHAVQACAALRAGIHVLCEKPLSDNLADAEAIVEADRKSAAVLTVGFHLHFHPALRRVHELIRAGDLGSIHHVHCLVGTYATLVNSSSRYQRDLEGALLLDYAHQPDLLFWLLGSAPRGVYAIGGQGGDLPLQSRPNFVAVSCDYGGPFISTIHLNYLQAPDRHEYEIVGDRGWISLDMVTGTLRLANHGAAAIQIEHFSLDRNSLYQMEHQAFLDAIAGSRKPESPSRDALVSMKVVAAALDSLRQNLRIPLTPNEEIYHEL